ncbi:hypothetical protein [Azohydromonas lata]|uniref:hypothetical protein n=1 Tax=Azohydromonas lata TaxID=45677 RepID=UPI0012F4CB3C|nr:hypothetical protein [Azohydromonas lata]
MERFHTRHSSTLMCRTVRELLRQVLTELQGFELLALLAGHCAGGQRHHGAALASVGHGHARLWAAAGLHGAGHQRQHRAAGT